jgi:hypothetical protein
VYQCGVESVDGNPSRISYPRALVFLLPYSLPPSFRLSCHSRWSWPPLPITLIGCVRDGHIRAAIVAMYNFPLVKKATLEALETIFATKTIARQLALAIALETGMVTLSQFFAVVNSVLANFSSRSRLIRHLKQQQDQALAQDDWMDLAERIDNVQGNDVWRSDPNSLLYERDRISARIDEFVHLMRRRDIFELMFVLRGGIGRNKFGLLHEGLFSKAMAGTKVLVET